jgi:hypothetical protein
VEQVFGAIKKREQREMELLDQVWDWVKRIAAIAGGALETPILIGAVAAFAPFAAIGAGYMAAAEDIKRKRSAIGFSEGVVMGVLEESPENLRDYFWEEQPTANPAFEAGAKIGQYYYDGGLALAYAFGKQVSAKKLGTPFWADLKRHAATAMVLPGGGRPTPMDRLLYGERWRVLSRAHSGIGPLVMRGIAMTRPSSSSLESHDPPEQHPHPASPGYERSQRQRWARGRYSDSSP